MHRFKPFLAVVAGLAFASPALAASAPVPVALLGRLHLPLLHFPIALLFVVLIIEVLIRLGRVDAERSKEVVRVVVSVAAVAAVVTAVAGLAYATGEDFDGADHDAFVVHRAAGIATAVAAVILALAARSAAGLHKAYLPLLVLSVVGVSVAGHEGGELVNGDGFYTAPFHEPVKDGAGKGSDDGPVVSYDDGDGGADARERHPEGVVPEKPDYKKDIQPIFQRSCVKCHGPEKRKSGLRLDVKRFAFKGGESGAVAIVAGTPDKSLVYTMSAKAADDEDIMPSRGKLLALSEIETLKRWIEQGAVWPDEPATP